MSQIKLYRHPLSGHAHRVELFLSILGLEAELINVDLMQGEQKSDWYKAKNSFAQVPLLEDGDTVISDSNAILVYLASQYDPGHTWLPKEPAKAAEVQRFLSVAAGEIAQGPAAARLIQLFSAQLDVTNVLQTTDRILNILDYHLNENQWLAGDHPTIADIANYTYIAYSHEGGVSLQTYKNIRAWLQRIESLSGFVPMQSSDVEKAA